MADGVWVLCRDTPRKAAKEEPCLGPSSGDSVSVCV